MSETRDHKDTSLVLRILILGGGWGAESEQEKMMGVSAGGGEQAILGGYELGLCAGVGQAERARS